MRLVAGVSTLVLTLACPISLHAQPAPAATIPILHFNDVYEIMPIEAGKAGGLRSVRGRG